MIWRPRASAWMLTVVCKATFVLRPQESTLAKEQEPANELDEHWNDDAGRSLRAPSDLVPVKPRVDVVLVGHAFAPSGAPTRSLAARLVVGEIDKTIEVFCDRSFSADGTLREGARFSRMPLFYERAAGGPDTSNPVGIRANVQDTYGRIIVPNLQPPGMLVATPADFITPTGFGPVASAWPSRREKLGRHGTWSPSELAQQPMPEGIDLSYFNHAPRDQQIQTLHEDERLVLENLHPEHPRLVTRLPGLRPRATIERPGGAPQQLTLRCDTLWIDTDRSLCTLTWRGQVPIEHPQERGRIVIALDQPAQSAARAGAGPGNAQSSTSQRTNNEVLEDFSHLAQDAEPNLLEGTMTLAPGLTSARVMPFAQSPAGAAPARGEVAPAPSGAGLPFHGAPQAASAHPLSQSSSAWGATPLPAPVPPARSSQSSSAWSAVQTPPPAPHRRKDSDVFPAPAPPSLVRAPVSAGPIASEVSASPWQVPEPRSAQVPLTVGQLAAQPTASPELLPAPVEAPRAAPTPRLEVGTALQLIWFDPEEMPRIRRKEDFQVILDELSNRPLDADLDDPAIAGNPMAVEDRRETFEVLARGEAVDEAGLNEALVGGVREDGKFVSPFFLFAGELSFPFDELQRLRATVTTAAPFTAGDELLKATIADAREFLQAPDLLSPPGVTEGFTTRIEEAVRKARRAVPQGYLEEQTERVLLERRYYQRRSMFGGKHLRALLLVGRGSRPVPAYLPEALAEKLPMYARFRARVLAELCLQEDQYEAHPGALRVTALARVVAAPRR